MTQIPLNTKIEPARLVDREQQQLTWLFAPHLIRPCRHDPDPKAKEVIDVFARASDGHFDRRLQVQIGERNGWFGITRWHTIDWVLGGEPRT